MEEKRSMTKFKEYNVPMLGNMLEGKKKDGVDYCTVNWTMPQIKKGERGKNERSADVK